VVGMPRGIYFVPKVTFQPTAVGPVRAITP
jgi:hypothetical protein